MGYDQRKFVNTGERKLSLFDICKMYILAVISCDDKKRQHLHFVMSEHILIKYDIGLKEDYVIKLHGIISEMLTDNLDQEINLPEFCETDCINLYSNRLEKKIEENELIFLQKLFSK